MQKNVCFLHGDSELALLPYCRLNAENTPFSRCVGETLPGPKWKPRDSLGLGSPGALLTSHPCPKIHPRSPFPKVWFCLGFFPCNPGQCWNPEQHYFCVEKGLKQNFFKDLSIACPADRQQWPSRHFSVATSLKPVQLNIMKITVYPAVCPKNLKSSGSLGCYQSKAQQHSSPGIDFRRGHTAGAWGPLVSPWDHCPLPCWDELSQPQHPKPGYHCP